MDHREISSLVVQLTIARVMPKEIRVFERRKGKEKKKKKKKKNSVGAN
jgi:hypothetical protein